ncbi:MAG: GNAT family N-acetyltransferase [Beggiatoa sp.]|nr:GNAT family N-acetyltransferase [Beggiatoa sp.]
MAADRPAGRLYVNDGAEEIRLMDLALLPAYRGQGIGSSLLDALLAEGQQAQKPVTITSRSKTAPYTSMSDWASRGSPTAESIGSWNGVPLPSPPE